jgi:hypothetical protein
MGEVRCEVGNWERMNSGYSHLNHPGDEAGICTKDLTFLTQ